MPPPALAASASWQPLTRVDGGLLRSPAYRMNVAGSNGYPYWVISRANLLARVKQYAWDQGGSAVCNPGTDTVRYRGKARNADTWEFQPAPARSGDAECCTCGQYAREHGNLLELSCGDFRLADPPHDSADMPILPYRTRRFVVLHGDEVLDNVELPVHDRPLERFCVRRVMERTGPHTPGTVYLYLQPGEMRSPRWTGDARLRGTWGN
ncbi:hypothetical protein ACGRHY_28055 [Streptomyces sp. HK10]|uniref:hypothetical protein n=1 Tax=Streptomyces sp. HK10 TaxID=3373255 RepID=UPI00374839A9